MAASPRQHDSRPATPPAFSMVCFPSCPFYWEPILYLLADDKRLSAIAQTVNYVVCLLLFYLFLVNVIFDSPCSSCHVSKHRLDCPVQTGLSFIFPSLPNPRSCTCINRQRMVVIFDNEDKVGQYGDDCIICQ